MLVESQAISWLVVDFPVRSNRRKVSYLRQYAFHTSDGIQVLDSISLHDRHDKYYPGEQATRALFAQISLTAFLPWKLESKRA